MQNYQMFFPFSSSSTPNSQALTHFNGGGSNTFLGFRSLLSSVDKDFAMKEEVVPEGQHASSQPPQGVRIVSDHQTNNENGDGGIGKSKKGKKKVRRQRYAFQTRSQVDILDDGYRWRKYGQKAVKNNKFPRSYYKCTYQECNVKKQVQRLTGDEGVVVTTYEGLHNHPIQKPTDNFENILSQMQIYTPFLH